jgi:ketosteroid isomerase-like protein
VDATTKRELADDNWVTDFFRAADTFSVPHLLAWFADEVEVRFGNAPPILGKAAAEQAFQQFYSGLKGMRHRCESQVIAGDVGAQMSIVTYTRRDGTEVSMPVASHLRRVGEKRIDRLWIFIDLTPLFAAAA